MTIPWREFTDFDERGLRAEDLNGDTYDDVSDWDITQYPTRRILGEHCFSTGTHLEQEFPVWRIKGGNQVLQPAGLELGVVNFDMGFTWSRLSWTASGPDSLLLHDFHMIKTDSLVDTENHNINWDNLSGRYKDKNGSVVWNGVSRPETPVGPEFNRTSVIDEARLLLAHDFLEFTITNRSAFGATPFWKYSDDMMNQYSGLFFAWRFESGPPWIADPLTTGQEIWGTIVPRVMRVRYFNPVANTISSKIWNKGGGDTVIFTGVNFYMSNNELNSYAGGSILAWNVRVRQIDIIGREGQGTTILTLAGGDYVIDNDGQITITATPALTPGTYEVLFKSWSSSGIVAVRIEAYAGDWKIDGNYRLSEATRFIILVRDGEDEGDDDGDEDAEIIVTDWEWKDEDGNTLLEHLAPMDTRAPDVFYHGRILSNTNYSREVNDQTGMFSVGDMTFDLANNDKHYSALLATYFLKNQFVSMYHARRNSPEAWKVSMIKMVVDDYELEGPVFRVHCKDVTNKYFQVTIPRNIIEEDFYPSAHESVLGQPMPDILGLHSLGGQTPGAVEARLIDTVTFKYIAAAGPLHSVTNVYSEGVLQTEGAVNDYTITYEDGGRTYINFNADQEEKKITFNCTGYTHAPWNSVNGYVQNPAYVILFVLAFLLEIPATRLDLASFDETAVIMGTLEVHTAGRWIGQEGATGENVIQELLWTYGAKLFVDRDGNLKLERKDLSNIATDVWVFDQIHCMKPTRRMFGLNEIVNVVKANYDYYPTASLFKSIMEVRNETSITNFEAESEGLIDPALKWTDSLTLAQLRTIEELIKFSEGYKKAEFVLPFRMIDDLDIMDNFRFQDPFGVAADGGGEFGRYYYVISIRPNHMNMTLEITAIDLTWLIEQESGSGSG